MNGWQRLWVLITAIASIAAIAFVFTFYEPYQQPELHKVTLDSVTEQKPRDLLLEMELKKIVGHISEPIYLPKNMDIDAIGEFIDTYIPSNPDGLVPASEALVESWEQSKEEQRSNNNFQLIKYTGISLVATLMIK